jgi:hypothetical protein
MTNIRNMIITCSNTMKTKHTTNTNNMRHDINTICTYNKMNTNTLMNINKYNIKTRKSIDIVTTNMHIILLPTQEKQHIPNRKPHLHPKTLNPN